jgi:hypothetical protein
VLAVIYGLKRVAEQGVSATSVAIVLTGLVIGVLFVRRQGTLAYPLLELKLFRQSRFAAAIAAYGLSCLAMFAVLTHVFRPLAAAAADLSHHCVSRNEVTHRVQTARSLLFDVDRRLRRGPEATPR